MKPIIDEVLIPISNPQTWKHMKEGKIEAIVFPDKPERILYPFRVIVHVKGIGVVGCFDCDSITITIRPTKFLTELCLKPYLIEEGKAEQINIWHIKEGSVVEYETPFPLEMATGLKHPPQSWQYLHRDGST